MATPKYAEWTKEELIQRIQQLEQRPSINQKDSWRHDGEFDFSAYATHKIALKFCYSGWLYNGLAYQNKPTPLPTVEAVLFDALAKARMVEEGKGFNGCGWEKCGRTDRGVSAAGQVVSLYVRTALVEKAEKGPTDMALVDEPDDDDIGGLFGSGQTNSSLSSIKRPAVEHDYVTILNRLLPDTIRVLAWSPVSPTFSARYNCTHRHYKYLFSSLNLDISSMQEAAAYLVGLHDFRNLCKIDAGKQITIFMRRILSAEIVPVEGEPDMYVLNLIGSAFLYHQVRHIMAILLLVGRKLEHPEIVKQMLNVAEGAVAGVTDVLAQRPEYQMADGLPLILWECGYSDADVSWRTGPLEGTAQRDAGGRVFAHLQDIHERSRVFTSLNKHFLLKAAEMHLPREVPVKPASTPFGVKWGNRDGIDILYGGGASQKSVQYVPLMLRKRNDPVEMINDRWRIKRRDVKSGQDANDEEDDGGDE